MNMVELSVGKPLDIMRGKPEGCTFFVRDDGMYLLVNFNAPTPDEINQAGSDADFEARWTIINGIIMFTVKMGTLNWMDAPFSPQLEIAQNRLHLDDLSTGLPLMLIMTDARNAVIKKLRLISVSTGFTSSLIEAIKSVAGNSLDLTEYNKRVNSIYSRYSTEALVTMSAANAFRLKDAGSDNRASGTIRKSLAGIAAYVSKRPCPATLKIPQELEPYHYYVADAGHCIVCIPMVLQETAHKANDLDGYEVPVPAKYVLEHGYRITDGYIIVDVPYDSTFGVVIDDEYSVY